MKDSRIPRLMVMAGFLLIVLLIYLGVLYNIQITHYDEYLSRSLNSITKVETIEASRGMITDRNGRTLVSNDSVYNLTFDASLLKDGQNQNEAILRLLSLCQEQGLSWEDNLPISPTAPYTYTLDYTSDTQKGRFLTYLLSLKEAKATLGNYLFSHPTILWAVLEAEEFAELDTPDKMAEELPVLAFTSQLLHDAGLTPSKVLSLMRESLDAASLPQTEARQVLGVRYELALRKLSNYTDYVMVENIDTRFISLITDGGFAGAKVTSASVRQYETKSAAHILGTVTGIWAEDLETLAGKGYDGNDWIGRSGAEAAFEEYLKGDDGVRVVSTNSDGKVTGEYYEIEPEPGGTVELTIDLDYQQAVESALEETITKMNAEDGRDDRGAGAAVIKVGTGEVLALASYPTFDLSTYHQNYSDLLADPADPMFNRATQGTYAPGSTLKPLTAVAALEEGVTTLTEKLRDGGRWSYPNDPTGSGAYCWNRRGHGLVNVVQSVTVSCNYFFAEMGYRMGMDTFNEYLTAFGLGQSTGLETGDAAGLLPHNNPGENQAPWAAFGQSNQLYTPIQLANYIATLVSGGKHCEAHLLKSVKTYDNAQILATGNTEAVHTVEMKDSTVEAVMRGMYDLTATGSLSSYFKDCVVTAGAKTGTAQINANTTNNGVFVCFAPYENPEIAVAIVIEKGESGTALASTAVNIINAYFSDGLTGNEILPENQLLQ